MDTRSQNNEAPRHEDVRVSRTRALLLVVDTDRAFCADLSSMVASPDWEIKVAETLAGANELLNAGAPCTPLVVLIGKLATGRETLAVVKAVVKVVREMDPYCHVLLRASNRSAVTSVMALETGVDLCLPCDVQLSILEATVRRALRRRIQCFRCCGKRRSAGSRTAIAGNRRIPEMPDGESLTRLEERIWECLAETPDQLVPISTLLEHAWQCKSVEPRLLYEHVSTLRAKIAAVGWRIENKRGVGYTLRPRVGSGPETTE